MKFLHLCALTAALTFSAHAFAGQIPESVYVQTSSSGTGDCPTCEITVTNATPHIVKVVSNNDWIGYASYSQKDDDYRGAFEWKKQRQVHFLQKAEKVDLTPFSSVAEKVAPFSYANAGGKEAKVHSPADCAARIGAGILRAMPRVSGE